MPESKDIKALFDTQLKDRLLELEKKRKHMLQPYILALPVMAAAWFLGQGIVRVFVSQPGQGSALAVWGGVAIVLVIAAVVSQKRYRAYRILFKEQVVAEILKLYNPQWTYYYDQSITPDVYHASEIFRHHVDRYQGDDLVTGKIGQTDFAFSELHTQYKTVTYDSKGRRQEQWHTIFKGLFFHADFNKHIKGKTFVLPDSVESFLGKFGQTLQAMNKSRGELVKMEDPDFEKKFMVFGQDQIEPRYVLTPKIMQNLTRLQERTKRHMRLSFIGSRVYVAVTFYKALFEPRVFRSGVRVEDAQEMYDLFGLMESIVEEMDLNTRIWTKS